MKQTRKWIALALAGALSLSLLAGCADQSAPAASAAPEATPSAEPDTGAASSDALVIAEQGIFSIGGTVIESDGTFDVANYYTSREGSTAHVDHANVLYQIPENNTGLPMVFLAHRPAPPGRGGPDLGGGHHDHHPLGPDLVHPVPHRHLLK
ncbi:hypothetical protein [uncultured Intestinimonas sp.]|uniref:hypothetical protein n=1 Tax=uncultured Intestinimonas sp. TaxID=1689265 RepID=UPI0025FF8C9E|nr:hypothetical protein [uncultured Intestinimonas sp.]